jgi:putative peptidoglycan lipid II flippase
LASSLAAYVNLLTLLWMLRQRLGPIGGRALGRSLIRTLAATVPLWLACRALGPVADAPSGPAAGWTGAAVIGGGLAFVAAAALLRAPELQALLGMLRRGKGLPPSGAR